MRRFAIVAAVLAGGCEDYDYGPELLAWAPDAVVEVPTEDALVLETWLDFVDPDGDIAAPTLVHHKPDGTMVRYEDCRIPTGGATPECSAALTLDASARSFDKITAGTVELRISPNKPWFGRHVLEAWLVDREGFESDHATTVLELFAPERTVSE